MFEGTKVRMTMYFRFTVKPTMNDIWVAIYAYSRRFHREPELAYYNPTDQQIGDLLKKVGVKNISEGGLCTQDVPEGQVWFYVPGGYEEVTP